MSNNNPPKRFAERTGASGGTSGRPASGFDITPEELAIAKKLESDKAQEQPAQQEAVLEAPAPVPPPPAEEAKPVVISEATSANVVELSPADGFKRASEPPPVTIAIEQKALTPLQQLVKELDATEKKATVDLEGSDPRTRPGKEAAKRDAQEKLAGLREKYWTALRSGLGAMFLSGPAKNQAAFAKFVAEKAPAPLLQVAADDVYRDIARDVAPFMRSDRSFEPGDYARMLGAIIRICKDLELSEAPRPTYAPAVLKDSEQLVNHIRKLVRTECDDQLNKHYLRKRVFDAAWKIRYQEDVVPVVITGASEEEARGLAPFFNNRTIHVPASEEPSENSMFKALKALANKLKKS
jgi:hypothetical protein